MIMGKWKAAVAAASCMMVSMVNAAVIDAGALTTVTVEAPLFDPSLSDANGCDPAGCVGDLTRDGDLTTLDSRWSCKPALGPSGSTCSITYTFADSLTIQGLNIALYQGDSRTRTMEVYVDGVIFTTWTSSGTTSAFEQIVVGVDGESVELIGVLEDSEWLSIMEVEILADDGVDSGAVEVGTLGTITASATLYDTRLGADNGCDPAGCTASLTRDGDVAATSRWSCAPSLGGTCTISYDLGAVRDISEIRLALLSGATRIRTVEVHVDGALDITWTSSGTTNDFESIYLSDTSGEFIEVTGVLADSEWLSITEVEVLVLSASGDTEAVGLTPLASSSSSSTRLDIFYAKDGDFSTSWTCTGDPIDNDRDYYECFLRFNLVYYRQIKQVKIALADGADRAVDMRIAGRRDGSEVFITSSGTTDGFETYTFDAFTDVVYVQGVFASEAQTISISEVEFVEEVRSGQVFVVDFDTPFAGDETTTDKFAWSTDSDEALDESIDFELSSYATVTAIELQFPVGDTYKFDLELYNDGSGAVATITGLESASTTGWQSFDLDQYLTADQYVTEIRLVIKGTGSGAPGFKLLDARILGTVIANPTDSFIVGSTYIEYWEGDRYPDFVAERTGDQKAIMGAICAVKKASFDGVDCVGEDATATGTVTLSFGGWYVDGNIFMKSGVSLEARFSIDDSPYTTDIYVEEGAAGNTNTDAIVVMDGISNARIQSLWIRGLYDPDTSNGSPAVNGLGATCLSIVGSQNITCIDTEVRYCDGDAVVVHNSNIVNIDAGAYDEEYLPWSIGISRGTGLLVDSSDSVWVRRYTMYDNGVAGIHITGSNNFTFEATIGSGESEGEGNVGSLDGQQPIEVIVDSSSLVTFQDMKVTSANEPVMTISADSSSVSFNNCGFSRVESGTCVIETEDPSVVTAEDDELSLQGTCYVKV